MTPNRVGVVFRAIGFYERYGSESNQTKVVDGDAVRSGPDIDPEIEMIRRRLSVPLLPAKGR